MRPRRLNVVTGTGTEIGKTWVSAHLARRLLGDGLTVAVRKPAQSFAADDVLTDAHVLAEASADTAETVCPAHRWYPVPMAPPMAAAALGMPAPALADLVGEIVAGWPETTIDVGIVEGAGGVASPQAVDGDTADLARSLDVDGAILVADAGLGTINLVRLAMTALSPIRSVVYLNRYDDGDALHRANREWLQLRDRFEVAVSIEELAAYT